MIENFILIIYLFIYNIPVVSVDVASKLDYVKVLMPTPEDELSTPTLEAGLEGSEQSPPIEEDSEQSMDETTSLLNKSTAEYENPYLKQPTKLLKTT